MKKIFNYIMLAAVALSGLTLTACSDDALDTNQYNKDGVNILAFGPMPITRGETMRLTGTKLDKVKEVLFPEGNQKLTPSKTYIAGQLALSSNEEAKVTIPDNCVPGKLRLVTQAGDTVVSRSNISFVEEIKVADINPKHVHPGDVVTISGEFVWNIADVTFTAGLKVEAEDFVLNTRNEVQVRVPMEAQSGPVSFSDGSDGAEQIVICENLEVDAAVATAVSNSAPEFGDEITISGQNLDLVTKVDFPAVSDVPFTVVDDQTIKVEVPMTCVSGDVVLTSASGLSTSVAIEVPLATFASVDPKEDVNPGDEIKITGSLLNRIVRLVLPGDITLEQGDFTQTATTIKFIVPEGMGDGKVTMVQHENYSVQTDKIAMHHEGAETPIWQGNCVVGGWDNALSALSWGGYDWSTVKPGQVLSVYVTPNMNGDYGPQIRLGNGSWQALPSTTSWGDDGNLNLTAEDNVVRVTLTEADLDQLVNAGGLVVCGAWFTVTKVTLSALETIIWTGNCALGSWAQGMGDLSWGGYDWSTVEAGTTLKLTYEVDPEVGYINIRFGNGSWAALPSTTGWGNDGNYVPEDPSETTLQTVLTDDDMDQLINNGGLVICGAGIICKQVSLQ